MILYCIRVNNLENVINFSLCNVSIVILVNLMNQFHYILQSELIAVKNLEKFISRDIFEFFFFPVHITCVPRGILSVVFIIYAYIYVIIGRLKWKTSLNLIY